MEVTALCIRLLMNVLFLLCALDHKVDSVSLRVEPNKLQFFEYESVTFHCDGLHGSSGWKVAHKFKGNSQCRTTTKSSCTIIDIYPDDGGQYWCETGNGKKSNSVNIAVTAGSVILESPALPVMEGDIVTLRCRNKTTSSNLLTGFYKDGILIRNSFTGEITVHSVSKSDEGLYKCKISDGGESAESRLTVRDLDLIEDQWEEEDGKKNNSVNIAVTETPPCSDDMFFIFRSIIPVVLMAPLLLLLGLLHCGNLRGSSSRCVMCCDSINT